MTRTHLTAFGGFVLAGCLVLAAYYVGIRLPCPFLALTGWQCPLCGSTRAAASLLHGRVGQAFAYNQLLFVGVGFWLMWLLADWVVPNKVPKPRQRTWYVIVAAAALVFTVLRNL